MVTKNKAMTNENAAVPRNSDKKNKTTLRIIIDMCFCISNNEFISSCLALECTAEAPYALEQ